MKRGKILRQLVQVPGLGCRESGVRQQSWRRARVCIEEGDPIRQSRPQTSFAGGSAIRLGGRHGPTFTKKMILAKSSQAWKLTSWDWIQTVSLRTYQKRTQPARGLWMGWHFTLHCRLRMGIGRVITVAHSSSCQVGRCCCGLWVRHPWDPGLIRFRPLLNICLVSEWTGEKPGAYIEKVWGGLPCAWVVLMLLLRDGSEGSDS